MVLTSKKKLVYLCRKLNLFWDINININCLLVSWSIYWFLCIVM